MGEMIRRGVILSASDVTPGMRDYIRPEDFVVACDAGYRNAQRIGVRPDLVLGDFDSAPRPEGQSDQIVLPHVKDDTDTHYAARWLLEHGCREAVLLGVLGGKRLEHTLANLSTGLYLTKNGVQTMLADEYSQLHYLMPGKERVFFRNSDGRRWQYFSLFPLGQALEGVYIRGAFYPLENAVLTNDYPLGVSNEFVQDTIWVGCRSGYGLVVLTKDDQAPKAPGRA